MKRRLGYFVERCPDNISKPRQYLILYGINQTIRLHRCPAETDGVDLLVITL